MNSTGKTVKAILLFTALIGLSTTILQGQENLINFSLTGGVNYYANNFTLTPGVLASFKLYGPLRAETGYRWDTYKESSGSEILTVTNKVNYHTIPINFTCSWNNFDFMAGPSLHILNNGLLMLNDSIYTYEYRDISGNYQNWFCSLDWGVRYHINTQFAIEVSYNYGISSRYKNSDFERPIHLVSLNLHYRIY